jgi:hypothetical protein
VTRARGFGKLLAFALAACTTVLAVAPAGANFHIMVISEVFAGSVANPNAQYVELEMRAAGQNQVQGHSVVIYNAAGTQVGSSTFAGPLANSANLSSILVATVEAQTLFGVTPDLVMATAAIARTGGKACFDTIDCVTWGNYTGAAPAGNPFSGTEGLLPGSSATRTGPDSGDSAADFAFAKPSPRTNGGALGTVGCAPGFASAATSVAEDAGTAIITVNGCPSATVGYSTADGSATAGSDYTAVSGTLTFDAAGTSQTFSVPITADPASEPTETVKLRIRNQSTEFLGRADATLSITNVTPPPTPPSAPLNLTANASPGQIDLAWQAPSSSGSAAITGYRIYRGTTSGTETLLTTVGNVLAFNDTGLTGGATRFYQVSALNGAEGPRSNEVSGTTPPVPGVPRNVATTGGADRITVSWQAPLDDGGSAVTGYKVYRGSSAGSETLFAALGNVASFIDTPLATGVTFFYRVSARNANGDGPLSLSVAGRTTTPPSAPLNPAAIPSAGRIDVTWSAPSNNGGTAISSYRIYRGPDGASLSLRGTAAGLAFGDVSLPAGTTFFYAVSAVNAAGEGPLSAVVSATTPVPPAAPANVLAQPGSGIGQIRITWSPPPSNGGSPVTKYQIYRADMLIATINAPVSTFTDSGRQVLQSYTYRVSASNAVGEGAKSSGSCSKPFPWHVSLGCVS